VTGHPYTEFENEHWKEIRARLPRMLLYMRGGESRDSTSACSQHPPCLGLQLPPQRRVPPRRGGHLLRVHARPYTHHRRLQRIPRSRVIQNKHSTDIGV
jgi:hypothetical protein